MLCESKERLGVKMKNKNLWFGFGIFLLFMWVCTLISKSIYAYRLPMVSAVMPEKKHIEHTVEVEGIVAAGGEIPVTFAKGFRISSIPVHIGDRVEEGDVLFQIDLEDLEDMMKQKQEEITELSCQINALLENQALAQEKKELELARAREDYDTTSRLQNTEVGRAEENYAMAQEDLETNEEDEALKRALQQAAYGEADAKRDRDAAIKEAGRKVEDALFPETADAQLTLYQLKQEELYAQLSEYQEILDSKGTVTAKRSGIVTEIPADAGGRVPDTAVLLLSDETIPNQLKVTLDREQKKYVSLRDCVTVKLEGESELWELTVDYLSESKNAPGSYELIINLPENKGVPGLAGTVSRSEAGEKYSFCIPPELIYEENNRSFVYVLKEREGILGMEYYVDELTVIVLDKNENWAAVKPGVLSEESLIISSATKEIKKGDVVRWEGSGR